MLFCPTSCKIAKPYYPERTCSQEFIPVPSFPGGSTTWSSTQFLHFRVPNTKPKEAMTPYQCKGREACDH